MSRQALRGKFIIVPLATLAYLALGVVDVATGPRTGTLTRWDILIFSGLAYSAFTAPVVWSIARRDFAKPVPAWLCRSCGYTLLGLPSDICPECGERFNPDRVPDIARDPRGND